MQIIKSFLKLTIILFPVCGFAQSTNTPIDDNSEHFYERMDIKQQHNYKLILANNLPISRKVAAEVAQSVLAQHDKNPSDPAAKLSAVDLYNIQRVLINNIEWVQGDKSFAISKKPVFNVFYKQKANFFEVNEPDFFLAVNPIINEMQSKEQNNNGGDIFLNTRGVTLRGMIASQIGFDATLSDNQERGPSYFQNMIAKSIYYA